MTRGYRYAVLDDRMRDHFGKQLLLIEDLTECLNPGSITVRDRTRCV
ncbi:MAG TPA: hypothetical protein VIL34_11430 [Actinopolymorphaceae bacterium]|jgi:hypothetical protein